eukprot:SAG11_NODE_19266_length_470_cov_1.663073_2_plen_66_part_01
MREQGRILFCSMAEAQAASMVERGDLKKRDREAFAAKLEEEQYALMEKMSAAMTLPMLSITLSSSD